MKPAGGCELAPSRTRVGIDIVDVDRMRRSLRRRPRLVARVFTDGERADCDARADPAVHYAARFAAKEATRKALGRAIAWHATEVRSGGPGPPRLLLEDRVTWDGAVVSSASVSITHDAGVASAIVLVETQVDEAAVEAESPQAPSPDASR